MLHHDTPDLTADRVALPDGHLLRRLVPIAAGVGVLDQVATFALGFSHPHEL